MASLKHNCTKCGKPARIQSEFPFPVGKLINYVYVCGHMELRERITEIKEEEEEEKLDGFRQISQNDIKLINESVYDWESPSYIKSKDELKPYIREVFWSIETVPEYFCEECQEFHTRKHLYKFQREGVQFIEKTQIRALLADEMGLGKTPTAAVVLKENKQILLPALVIVKGTTLLQWYRELKSWSFGSFADVAILQNRNQFIPGHKVYVISMDFLSRKGVLELLNTLNLKCIIV